MVTQDVYNAIVFACWMVFVSFVLYIAEMKLKMFIIILISLIQCK